MTARWACARWACWQAQMVRPSAFAPRRCRASVGCLAKRSGAAERGDGSTAWPPLRVCSGGWVFGRRGRIFVQDASLVLFVAGPWRPFRPWPTRDFGCADFWSWCADEIRAAYFAGFPEYRRNKICARNLGLKILNSRVKSLPPPPPPSRSPKLTCCCTCPAHH